MDDQEFGNALVARGLLTEDELREAVWERQRLERLGKVPPFLWDVLIQKGFLSRVQVDEALASLQNRRRHCAQCEQPVAAPKVTPHGEVCPRCEGPVSWKIEKRESSGSGDTIVALAGELPAEVALARQEPGRILGKYVLVEEAGHGGAGVVYKAWDLVLRQYIAIKLLRNLGENSRLSHEDQVKDLIREARNAIKLRHHNIVPVYDAGVIGEQFYICMEYIEGDSLAAHIRASHKRDRLSPLYEDPILYLEIMRDVCAGVHYAHTFPKPIVHCDLKPGNILLDTELRPYLVDFGLARSANAAAPTESDAGPDSGPQLVRGTPAYMAPEQLSGHPELLGPWTDIYGIGAILYELLTGRPVFVGNAYEVMMKAMRETPKRPSDVVQTSADNPAVSGDTSRILLKSTKLEMICMRCIARDQTKRYATAKEVADELDRTIQSLRSKVPGAQSGVIPATLRRAQAHADLRHVQEQMTSLELEVAFQEMSQLEAAWKKVDMAALAADGLRQVKCLEAFKERMVERLNKRRPKLAKLELLDRTAAGVEVMRATNKMLVLFQDGESAEIVWQAVKPEQVVDLAWDVLGMQDTEDRLALGIYCKFARLPKRSRAFLNSLIGTALEKAARPLLDSV